MEVERERSGTNPNPTVVQELKNLKIEIEIGKTGNEKPLLPYKLVKHKNGYDAVKFETGDDRVMNAIIDDDLDALISAIQDPGYGRVTNILRINFGFTPMAAACGLGRTDLVEVLLLDGNDPLSYDSEGRTGIHLASLYGHERILDLIFDSADGDRGLLYHFANHTCFDLQRTPLHYAALPVDGRDKIPVVGFLLANEAFPQLPDSDGKFPSDLCDDGVIAHLLNIAVRRCLTHEEDRVFYPNDYPSEFMPYAEDNEEHLGDKKEDNDGHLGDANDEVMLDHLGDEGDNDEYPRDAEDNDGHLGGAKDGIDMSEEPFVIHESDMSDFVYIKFKSGHRDKVMEAVLANNPDGLLEALKEASEAGYVEEIIDMHRVDGFHPPLVMATIYDYRQCVKYLLDYGADVFACSHRFDTAIHHASVHARIEILQMLFDTAKKNKRRMWRLANHFTFDGKTPLHFAAKAESKSYDVVKYLLSKGADPRYADRNMKRPSELFCTDSDTRTLLLDAEHVLDAESEGDIMKDVETQLENPIAKDGETTKPIAEPPASCYDIDGKNVLDQREAKQLSVYDENNIKHDRKEIVPESDNNKTFANSERPSAFCADSKTTHLLLKAESSKRNKKKGKRSKKRQNV